MIPSFKIIFRTNDATVEELLTFQRNGKTINYGEEWKRIPNLGERITFADWTTLQVSSFAYDEFNGDTVYVYLDRIVQ